MVCSIAIAKTPAATFNSMVSAPDENIIQPKYKPKDRKVC
jgi:hypothetical protein